MRFAPIVPAHGARSLLAHPLDCMVPRPARDDDLRFGHVERRPCRRAIQTIALATRRPEAQQDPQGDDLDGAFNPAEHTAGSGLPQHPSRDLAAVSRLVGSTGICFQSSVNSQPGFLTPQAPPVASGAFVKAPRFILLRLSTSRSPGAKNEF